MYYTTDDYKKYFTVQKTSYNYKIYLIISSNIDIEEFYHEEYVAVGT